MAHDFPDSPGSTTVREGEIMRGCRARSRPWAARAGMPIDEVHAVAGRACDRGVPPSTLRYPLSLFP